MRSMISIITFQAWAACNVCMQNVAVYVQDRHLYFFAWDLILHIYWAIGAIAADSVNKLHGGEILYLKSPRMNAYTCYY